MNCLRKEGQTSNSISIIYWQKVIIRHQVERKTLVLIAISLIKTQLVAHNINCHLNSFPSISITMILNKMRTFSPNRRSSKCFYRATVVGCKSKFSQTSHTTYYHSCLWLPIIQLKTCCFVVNESLQHCPEKDYV